MKKVLLLTMCLLGLFTVNAQTKNNFYLYGVDFTHAKVYAALESLEEFAQAFEGINMLLVTEPEKYDFSRMLNKRVDLEIEPMLDIVSSCDYSDLKILDDDVEDLDCSAIVKSYVLEQTEGTGIVMIAKLLSKPEGQASYELVVFDIASREILSQKEVIGKAKGFGLRNYWAGSIYSVLRNYNVIF